jgi:hypothetical protein
VELNEPGGDSTFACFQEISRFGNNPSSFIKLKILADRFLRNIVERIRSRDVVARFYLGAKISGLASLAAEEVETMLIVASSSLVTGGRQISVLQAW